MNDSSAVFTVSDVRAKLDAVIDFATTRADARLASATSRSSSATARSELALAEHALGRLAGLLEARELLDLLEAPAPAGGRPALSRSANSGFPYPDPAPRTPESDLREDR